MKLELWLQIFENFSNIKFIENPSIGIRVVPWGRGRRTDMTKLIVPFRNFANVPKNAWKRQFIMLSYGLLSSPKWLLRLVGETWRPVTIWLILNCPKSCTGFTHTHDLHGNALITPCLS